MLFGSRDGGPVELGYCSSACVGLSFRRGYRSFRAEVIFIRNLGCISERFSHNGLLSKVEARTTPDEAFSRRHWFCGTDINLPEPLN